jgi:hypothetical protein
MEPKSLFTSKTVIFNILTLLAISLTSVADSTIITENPVATGVVAVLVSLVNVGLRLVTKVPVK